MAVTAEEIHAARETAHPSPSTQGKKVSAARRLTFRGPERPALSPNRRIYVVRNFSNALL